MEVSDKILSDIARQILLIDENNNSLLPKYLDVLTKGLKPLTESEKNKSNVIIIGAGISGLLSGKLLKDAGYNVTILEANGNRIGGRIKTFHSKFSKTPPFADAQQYAEAGAMRIPSTHKLTNTLIEQLNLPIQTFYNVDVEKDSTTNKAFRTWIMSNGIQVRKKDYNDRTLPLNQLNLGFPIDSKYNISTTSELLENSIKEIKTWIDQSLPIDKQIEGWKKIIQKYDDYSMLTYLKEYYDDDTIIQYIGTIEDLTSRLFLSFLHSFIDTFYINSTTVYNEIKGGNWQLPYAFENELEHNIVMNTRVVKVTWNTNQGDNNSIIIESVKENNQKNKKIYKSDYLISSIPFSALRFVSFNPILSYHKRRAIMDLHYDSSTKVLIEFSERFWEWDENEWQKHFNSKYKGHNSFGGGSISDNANRFIYYPSHQIAGSNGGVILASYTWSDEANRWDSLSIKSRYEYALAGLVDLYGQDIVKYATGYYKTQSWMDNQYSFGEAAVFTPGQLKSIHPYVATIEGPIHFAGEHTSLKHAWIEGAVESAIRVALEIRNK